MNTAADSLMFSVGQVAMDNNKKIIISDLKKFQASVIWTGCS
jgi:hypothetical protein